MSIPKLLAAAAADSDTIAISPINTQTLPMQNWVIQCPVHLTKPNRMNEPKKVNQKQKRLRLFPFSGSRFGVGSNGERKISGGYLAFVLGIRFSREENSCLVGIRYSDFLFLFFSIRNVPLHWFGWASF